MNWFKNIIEKFRRYYKRKDQIRWRKWQEEKPKEDGLYWLKIIANSDIEGSECITIERWKNGEWIKKWDSPSDSDFNNLFFRPVEGGKDVKK